MSRATTTDPLPPQNARTWRVTHLALVSLLLVALTWLALSPVLGGDFLVYDDDQYITDHARVRAGLSLDNVTWAMTSFDIANWHPLTWLSWMLDVELFGLNPRGSHAVNLLLHSVNALLLLACLLAMTGALWRSAAVALLFAIHPLHVESVAWISQRKDVLSTCFGLLAVLAYVRYARRPEWRICLLVALLLALSLMAKPMLVTLPALLLLLDYWPLRRWRAERAVVARLLLEKLPLLLLCAVAAALALAAQRAGGAVTSLQALPLPARVLNAAASYVAYILKTFWPVNLAAYYPYPAMHPPWPALALAALLLTTAGVLWRRRRYPHLVTGWFWYLLSLVPVIGLVQLGGQAMADRYTYVPLIGLFMLLVWSVPQQMLTKPAGRALAAVLLGVLMALSWVQARLWQNTEALFTHTLQVTSANPFAHRILGKAISQRGDLAGAERHFRQALRLAPQSGMAHHELATVLFKQRRLEESITHYRRAAELEPRFALGRENLALALGAGGHHEESLAAGRRAVALGRRSVELQMSMGLMLVELDRPEEAIAAYRDGLVLDPAHAQLHNNLGVALAKTGRLDQAILHFRQAVRLRPDYLTARQNLEKAQALRQPPEAPAPAAPQPAD